MTKAEPAALPGSVDAVVIGGGVIGLCTALYLARAGRKVLLLEKGRLGAEQSERAFGWISNLALDPRKLGMSARAKALWAEIDRESGGAAQYRRTGILMTGSSDAELVAFRSWLDEVAGHPSTDARIIDAAEAGRLLPGMTPPPPASLYGPSDGTIEPRSAVAAVALLAREAGVVIREGGAVRGLRMEGGRVSGVETEAGPVACRDVVLAGGIWSRMFCARHGISLPQLDVESSLLRTGPVSGAPGVCLQNKGANFRPCADGSYVIAPDHGHIARITPTSIRLSLHFLPALLATRGLLTVRPGLRSFLQLFRGRRWRRGGPSPFERAANRVAGVGADRRLMLKTLASARARFAAFRQAEVRTIWAGRIDATPDSTPVISAVASHPGFWISTGFSGMGLTHAPAAGEALAAAITGSAPPFDLEPYRLSRFFDGTKLVVRE